MHMSNDHKDIQTARLLDLPPEIHPLADVNSVMIGHATKVWQFVVILDGAILGKNCNINAHCLIEDGVVIGDNVTLKCGVFLWKGMKVGNNVFIGPNATFANDKYPRSKEYPAQFEGIIIENNASIGANATVLPGLKIGEYSMVGAGSVVTHDVPPYHVVVGNPAKTIRVLSYDEIS